MLTRRAALTVIFAFMSAPAVAQEQSFAAFTAALWPDAQAKGITRATFDLAKRRRRSLALGRALGG